MKRFNIVLASLLAFSPITNAVPMDEPRTADAVKMVDDGWMDAEIRGDGSYLSRLLLDGYVSIGSSGAITTKEQIIDRVVKRGRSEQFAKKISEWKATHPTKASVVLYGDTAILTWVSITTGQATPVRSCDIFVYRDGHWHAVYSQHSLAESG